MYTKEDIQDKLRNGIYKVTFTKVNGEKRVMPCTLMESAIPTAKVPATASTKEPSAKELENLRVYALESQGWRSFKIANVIDIEPQLVKTADNKWTATVQEGETPDELLLPLPQEVLSELGWTTDSVIKWKQGENGNWILSTDA